LRVLVVDDEPEVREVISKYLTGDGHVVVTANNGREGLEKFHAGRFDLVLADRSMPEMSGDDLAAAIQRIAPRKPVILLTGFGEIMQSRGERPRGVSFVVSKPPTLSAMREAIALVTARAAELGSGVRGAEVVGRVAGHGGNDGSQ